MISFQKILDRIPPIDEKHKYHILGGVLLAIFLLDYFLVMNPQLQTMRNVGSQITLLKGDFKKAKDDISRIVQYRTELNRQQEKASLLSHRVIKKEEIPAVLENISRIANQHSIKIDQIMPMKGSETSVLSNGEGVYYALPIMVNARGGYHDIGRFLNQLENEEIFLEISDFSLVTGGSEETARPIAKLTVKVIYFEPKNQENK